MNNFLEQYKKVGYVKIKNVFDKYFNDKLNSKNKTSKSLCGEI